MPWILLETGTTFLVGVAFVSAARRISLALGLVDRPDAVRKRHTGTIPLCGGVAIFTAFACICLLAPTPSLLGLPFWLALGSIVGLGMLDDRISLPASGRLAAQLFVSVLIAAHLPTGSLSIGGLFPPDPGATTPILLPVLLVALFLICVVFMTGLINAWNMLDGIDGLAGGTAAVSLVWLIVIASFAGMPDLVPALETLLVCICAFLVFNMRSPWRARASVFLGDAGSTALGMVIACVILTIATGDVTNDGPSSAPVSFPALLWVVILPVMDTLSLIVRRTLAGRSPMSGDRWHLHHLLLDHGMTTSSATVTLMILAALSGGVAYAGIRFAVPGEIMAAGLFLPVGLHTVFVLVSTGTLTRARLAQIKAHLKVEPRNAAAGPDMLGARAPVIVFTRVGDADRDA